MTVKDVLEIYQFQSVALGVRKSRVLIRKNRKTLYEGYATEIRRFYNYCVEMYIMSINETGEHADLTIYLS